MRTILEYLDAAIERQELGSDRQLSRLLGLSGPSVSAFRTEKALPSPETMVKLARLAGLDEQVALVELAFMSADGDAKTTYEKILKRISAFIPATLFGLACLHPDKAFASNISQLASVSPTLHAPEMCVMISAAIVYYGKGQAKTAFNAVSKKPQNQIFTNPVQNCVSGQKTPTLQRGLT